MKKAIVTFGLLSCVMVLTSFTTPEQTPAQGNDDANLVGTYCVGRNKKVDLVGTYCVGRNKKVDLVGTYCVGRNKKVD